MIKKQLLKGIIFILPWFTVTNCTTVSRLQNTQVVDLSGRWNDIDAQLVAEAMSEDIVARSWLTNFIQHTDRQPVVMVGSIVNKSHEHIDAEPFIKDIERELINKSTVKIVAHGAFKDKLRQERADQLGSVLPSTQKQFGRELGADFMLFGTINSIVDSKARGRHQVVFYQVNLELIDLGSNEVVWIGEKKIKKYIKK